MSFKLEQGLFKLDLTDHHAILGVTVDAKPEQIRERYKLIARMLHPDSCQSKSPKERDLANKLLSRFVNQAYDQLSKDRKRKEHLVVLEQVGKRLAQEPAQLESASQAAKILSQASQNLDLEYKSSVQKLATKQYEHLDQALEAIALLSELNMVFLMKKEGQKIRTEAPVAVNASSTLATNAVKQSQPKPVEPPPKASMVEPYLRRADEYIKNNNMAKAILELRDALNLEPNNSTCNSLLGMVYLKQNQTTMAKMYINKALQVNPKDPLALQGKQALDKLTQKAPSKSGFLGMFGNKK
ncbi:MAG: DnaJ domain-containing protein [Cyanosarcina radialis HA8281-LM2]|jgi:curved DNA-binding protein CbpA|nr:DnaJ domain-containing protein [Cyanosarcina radialis HA8281-LM2]